MAKRPAKEPKQSPNQRMIAQWKERVKHAMEDRGWSQRRLAIESKLGHTTVRHLLMDANDVYLSTLAKIADATGVSLVWLVSGLHAIANSGGPEPKNIRVLPVWSQPELGSDKDPKSGEYIAVRTSDYPDDVQAVVVSDQSMLPEGSNQPPPHETIIVPGDVVLFARSTEPESGNVVVAQGPRGTVVRRCAYQEDGKIVLISNHHLFPKLTVGQKQIYGTVLGVHRKLVK